MQKLIWQNADGEEINLTGGNYGITAWEGFSNTSLNIQSQQVPFQDGGVFLDALLEQRELSVTLAIYDGNNLETRYRLRRELIHILNPKLGEGYLIYTNDFTSKRIKCVPQIPLFETHNSNDSGTPKASLAWTACEPYWEDLEETSVLLNVGSVVEIENNGDVETSIKVEMYSASVKNPIIKNNTENKFIKLNGQYSDGFFVDTGFGEKRIATNKIDTFLLSIGATFFSICYAENLNMFVIVGDDVILTKKDDEDWTSRIPTNNIVGYLKKIIYVESLNLFVAVGNNRTIVTSQDGKIWEHRDVSGGDVSFSDVTYSEKLNLLVAVSGYFSHHYVFTSSDGVEWVRSEVDFGISSVIYSEDLEKYIGVYVENHQGIISTSEDGYNWNFTNTNIDFGTNLNMVYADQQGTLLICGSNGIYKSIDFINFTKTNDTSAFGAMIYSPTLDKFFASKERLITISDDGENWTSYNTDLENVYGLVYSINNGCLLSVGYSGQIGISNDGESWNIQSKGLDIFIWDITYSEKYQLYCAVGAAWVYTSLDGKIWHPKFSYSYRTLDSVIFCEEKGLFIVVGNDTIAVSSDGDNWNRIAVVDHYESVDYSENLKTFVAVGKYGAIAISEDGYNWNKIETEFDFDITDITHNEEKFIAVGGEKVLISDNGVEWQLYTNAEGIIINKITYAKDLTSFVGVNGFGNLAYRSKDGINWIKSQIATSFNARGIAYSDYYKLIICVGSNGLVYKSSDVKNWTLVETGTENDLNSVFFVHSKNDFVIVGDRGTVLETYDNIFGNLISNLNNNSDMSLGLVVGNNKILLNREEGLLIGVLKYRQKYLGV